MQRTAVLHDEYEQDQHGVLGEIAQHFGFTSFQEMRNQMLVWSKAMSKTSRLWQEAEDYVQDVLAKMVKKPEQFLKGNTRSFLYQSVHNEFAQGMRRNPHLVIVDSYMIQAESVPDHRTASLELSEVIGVMDQCIAKIAGTDHGRILALRRKGIEYDEIQHVEEIPMNTVRARCRRGRLAVHDLMVKQLGSEDVIPNTDERWAHLEFDQSKKLDDEDNPWIDEEF